jgi:hypothetical protein
MNRIIALSVPALLLVAGAGTLHAQEPPATHLPADHSREAQWVNVAKITLDDAMDKALEKTPGKALSAELKGANGHLLYEVEIVKADDQIMEVLVDAETGRILEARKVNKREGKEGNEKEGRENEND